MQIHNTPEILKEAQHMVKVLEPLFYTLIKTSKHHGLDTIEISTLRAVEIQADLLVLKKKLQFFVGSAESPTDKPLDQMFGRN